MRLASYNVRGRTSYGAVVGNGVVDLRLRLGARHSGAATWRTSHDHDLRHCERSEAISSSLAPRLLRRAARSSQ
jgi:hypothetical protein